MLIPSHIRGVLISLIKRRWKILLVLFLFVTIQTTIATAGDPLILKFLVDTLQQGNIQRFSVIGIGAVVFFTAMRVLEYFYSVLKARVRLEVMSDYSKQYAALYFGQPYQVIRENGSGYFTGRIYDESKELAGALNTAIDVYRAIIGFVTAVGVCLWLSWQLALAVSIIVPVLLVVSQRFSRTITASSSNVQEAEARLRTTLSQLIGSFKLYNIMGGARLPHKALDAALSDSAAARLGLTRHTAFFAMSSGILLSYAELAVLLGSGIAVISGNLTVGGLFSFMAAYWRAIGSARALIELSPQLATLEGVATRMKEFQAASVLRKARDLSEADELQEVIALRDVGIDLDSDRSITHISFGLRRGDRALVAGRNGTGKSTLVDVICGLRDPTSGSARLPPPGRISCQFTDLGFFPGTVHENLSEVAGESSEEWLRAVGLLACRDSAPMLLSAGEQRRLQIAMTLAREADLYVFDEPLAYLDDRSKDQLFKLIMEKTEGRALAVVMHGDRERESAFNVKIQINEDGSVIIADLSHPNYMHLMGRLPGPELLSATNSLHSSQR